MMGTVNSTAIQKGNALEEAVHAIEATILRQSPTLKENTYSIESKKRITVDGVLHEIDLFVTFYLANGYQPIYIFECKNWEAAVGKNEIIIFSEKIAAAQAQHGFFVAKSFTADAQAQAKKDPRITLLMAMEYDPKGLIVPFGFHFITQHDVHVEVSFFGPNKTDADELAKLDIREAQATLNGTKISLEQFVQEWMKETCNANLNTFPSGKMPEGDYDRVAESVRTFQPKELFIEEKEIERGTLKVKFKVQVSHPVIASHFEVASRGRVLTLAPVDCIGFPTLQVRLIFPESVKPL